MVCVLQSFSRRLLERRSRRMRLDRPLEQLQLLLENTPAQPFVTTSNQKMFGSIRAVTTSAMSALEYI